MARVDNSFLSSNEFAQCAGVHPATVRGIKEKLGYTTMTKIQALTIPLALQGLDIVAKAQTGTGKTIGFLVPVVNRAAIRGASAQISAVVLSPTRELAMQIFNEANALLTFHNGLTAVVVVGGTNMNRDVRELQKVNILVATPGRLLDHLQNTSGFAARLANLDTFTLDEADRMLDMGFRPDLERIVSYCHGSHKQTLLFSATVAPEVIELAPKLLSAEFMFVDSATGKSVLATAGKNAREGAMRLVADDPFVTAKQVTQEFTVAEQDKIADVVVDILMRERQVANHKVMVFFTTARLTQLFSELFVALGCPVLEIHSRKSQSHRQKTSDAFRDSSNVMMFTSDVTARGMDYPDVTLVLQVGLPSSAEQYVHRLGRTGRAGMQGKGVLMLMPEETFFLRGLAQLKITQAVLPQTTLAPGVVLNAMQRVAHETKCMAYAAWLGFYNSFASKLRWSKEFLVSRANQFAIETLKLSAVPALEKKTIGKMGLKGVPGLVIEGVGSHAPPRREQPARDHAVREQPTRANQPVAARGRGAAVQVAPSAARGGRAHGGGQHAAPPAEPRPAPVHPPVARQARQPQHNQQQHQPQHNQQQHKPEARPAVSQDNSRFPDLGSLEGNTSGAQRGGRRGGRGGYSGRGHE